MRHKSYLFGFEEVFLFLDQKTGYRKIKKIKGEFRVCVIFSVKVDKNNLKGPSRTSIIIKIQTKSLRRKN
jgi:hypothetical protein